MVTRFVSGLTVADLVTLFNAVLGFLAITFAPTDPELAARIILLAAVMDGLDGIIARHIGGSEIGPYLDSLSDVASFALAPAILVYALLAGTNLGIGPTALEATLVLLFPATFVALGVLRLGVYSTYDTASTATIGAPTTLAATILGAAALTAYGDTGLLLFGSGILALSMIAPIEYPDLLARDALIMGVIHVLAVLFPDFYGRIFPYALLTLALSFLVLGPVFYWGETERRLRSGEGKR